MYSASADVNETHACFLENPEMQRWPKKIKHSEVDFLSEAS